MASLRNQPQLLNYCAALYERFLAESTVEVVDDVETTVWRGKLIATTVEVGIPDGTYKRVVDQLTRMKCIEQIDRGFRGNYPTTMILLRPPTMEVWQEGIDDLALTRGETPAILSRRIEDMERRLEGIDVKQALVDLQQQVDDSNKRIKELSKKLDDKLTSTQTE